MTKGKKRHFTESELEIVVMTWSHGGRFSLESDDADSQREEDRTEPLTVPQSFNFCHFQENNEGGSQRQEQRAESFTMVQDNVPQEVDDVHSSHGLTEGQSIISILSFALRHNTTGVLMEDLLKLLKLHSARTSAVPTSTYFLEKPLADITHQFERHHYCRVCTKYVGSSQSLEKTLKCVSCSSFTTVKASLQEGHLFIHIPLKDQLKDILENQGMHDLCFCADASTKNVLNDICDGTLYQTLKNNSKEDFLSLTFNCDGVPVFSPPNKPDMSCFFKPFVEECANLSQAGFAWHPSDQLLKHIKVHTLCCVCDAVARPLLHNFKQFNGEYGCGVCLHPGMQTRKGKGSTRVYTCPDEKPSDRNHKTTVQIGQIAEREGKTILGIKGSPALADLPLFDLINGMVPDYMHCVLLGVCRYMATFWIDSKSSSEPWYIGTQTSNYCCSSSKSSNRTQVAALAFVLQLASSKAYFHRVGISILLGSELNAELINHAHDTLVYFVGGVQSLYGKEHMTFNVHSLLHLSKTVVHWGPLWAHSTFMFEDFNGYLLKQVKSSGIIPCFPLFSKAILDKCTGRS
ncbi:hypothetical protein N1851_019214 [Merluccius polli]|uniref:Uncharacterized protein n=1 Tax=Merluccius polli TaxID=89951 RepID=A0AA47NZF7_MERPO|nr:hypothetical protein N1851_019214 [Merluccius polli]